MRQFIPLKLPRPLTQVNYKGKDTFKLLVFIFAVAIIFIYQSSHKVKVDFDDSTRKGFLERPSNSAVEVNYPGGTVANGGRKIIPMQDRKNEDEIVYAAFGSSVTWGSQLSDRESLTYVKRLSFGRTGRATNFGMRSTGPNYPAACAYSLIGDQEFDVIILEYFMRVEEGFRPFALRLRERFKNALIIVIRLWAPYQFTDIHTNINLSNWAAAQGFGRDYIHDPKFPIALQAYGEENFRNRYLEPGSTQVLIQEAVAKEIGAYIVKMHIGPKAYGPGGWISFGDNYLSQDSFHLSKGGHGILADQIRDIVKEVGVPKHRELGQFSGLDKCDNWFETGEIGEGITYSPNGKITKMPNTEKFVLSFETGSYDDDFAGWIGISNESSEVMDLFVSYMTTGPPPSKYPRVEVMRDDNLKSKFILEPESVGWGDKDVHVVRLGNIGQINPGSINERIYFKPLENSEYPFRITGIAITPVYENGMEKLAGLEWSGPLST